MPVPGEVSLAAFLRAGLTLPFLFIHVDPIPSLDTLSAGLSAPPLPTVDESAPALVALRTAYDNHEAAVRAQVRKTVRAWPLSAQSRAQEPVVPTVPEVVSTCFFCVFLFLSLALC